MVRPLHVLLAIMLFATPAYADGVYLGIHGRGLMHFDGRRTKQLFKRPKFVNHVVPGSAGVLWIGSTLMMHRLNNGKLDNERLTVPIHMRVMTAGVPWYGNQKEVGWFDGAWRALLLPGKLGLSDFEIDGQGRVWIISDGKLQYTTGQNWTTFVGPKNQDVKHCELAARGDLYLVCWQDVFRLSNNTWSTVGKLDKVSAIDALVTADGTIYVVGFKKMYVLPPRTDPISFDVPNWNLRAFAVDGRGRMWFGHDNGLAVYDATGKKLRPPRALVTRDTVHSILVEGTGPDF